jgi:GAF domain-containing protein
MSEMDHIKKLIVNHTRRLQSLKEQQALNGLDTPPKILIEIDDIESEIAKLQSELRMLQVHLPPHDNSSGETFKVQLKETEIKPLRASDEKWKFISEIALTMHSQSTFPYRKLLGTLIDLVYLVMVKIDSYNDESGVYMIMLTENDGDLTVAAGRNLATPDQGRKISSEHGLIGWTLRTGEATISSNVQQNLGLLASITGYKSAICVPLKVGLNIYYGVLLVCNKQVNYFNQEHAKLLTHFCNHVVVALKNAERFEDLRQEMEKYSNDAAET